MPSKKETTSNQRSIYLFGLASLFNGISTLVGYLMPKPSFLKNSKLGGKYGSYLTQRYLLESKRTRSKSLTTIPQAIALTITPRGHPHIYPCSRIYDYMFDRDSVFSSSFIISHLKPDCCPQQRKQKKRDTRVKFVIRFSGRVLVFLLVLSGRGTGHTYLSDRQTISNGRWRFYARADPVIQWKDVPR